MNWALPLLFILLSPGFLLSLGSKCKISIMTILIHALIFTIIINVYEPVFEGFQASGSSPSELVTVTNSPTSTTVSNENASVTVSTPSGSTNSDLIGPNHPFVVAMSIPAVANAFYTENVARDPSMVSMAKLLPNDPTQPPSSGSEPTQYQKNTIALHFILAAFYQNNLKDICNMKDPTGSPEPWVPKPPPPPNPPACPECKPAPAAASVACTIM